MTRGEYKTMAESSVVYALEGVEWTQRTARRCLWRLCQLEDWSTVDAH